ncbi:MAG: DUF4058 family protein [Fimbriiglobus sp.]
MPLRDHFRPPLDNLTTWEVYHGGWPMVIVQHLQTRLPAGYVAEPRVHSGSSVVVAAFETDDPDYDEYEGRIYDARRGRHLVAAVEIVSPANKDRPEHRNAFVGKCAALLTKGVAVSVVDLVTTRHFNLYAERLSFIGQEDPGLGEDPPDLYAASCRWTRKKKAGLLEAWSNALTLGQPLPTLPLWLADDLAVPLDLEPSYEQACRDLRIP